MKNFFINQARRWAVMLCLLLSLQRGVAQFVELTAEIELNDWHYWFLEDGIALSSGRENTTSIFTKSYTIRCVVGTNTCMMEGDFFANAKATYWFTGTNIIRHIGERDTRIYESADGNPGRPVRVTDPLETLGKIHWLAFCSGSFLKRDGRQIFPPSGRWKQTISAPSGFPDKTIVFEDGFGLPKSIKLFTKNDQPVFQYQVRQSTNVLGWNFPLEFYLVQYAPARTNGWELHLTAKGRLTSIKEGTKPEIPAEVLKAVEK